MPGDKHGDVYRTWSGLPFTWGLTPHGIGLCCDNCQRVIPLGADTCICQKEASA